MEHTTSATLLWGYKLNYTPIERACLAMFFNTHKKMSLHAQQQDQTNSKY